MKKLLLLFFLATSIVCLHAQTLFLEENFDYGTSANSDITSASSHWARHSGTNGPGYTPTSLSYSGYKSSGVGGALSFSSGSSNDGDINTTFSPIATTGTNATAGNLYASFLVNLSSAKATQDYFFHLGQSTIGSNFKARVFARINGEGWGVALGKGTSAETPTQDNTVLDFNKTYLVVIKYCYNPAALDDDRVNLYLYDSGAPATEPGTPLVKIENVGAGVAGDPATLGTVAIRQGTNTPTGVIDGIRVSDSWDFSVSATTPKGSFSTKTVDFGNVVVGTPKTDSSVVITNTGASALNITAVASSNPKVTVTPATASIEPAASQKFYITYTPTEAVTDLAALVFTSNGSATSDTVTVTGTGTTEQVLSIKSAREDLDNDFIPDKKGQVMQVSGVVVSPDFTASAKGNNYYITDGTAGVLLYTTKKLSTQLNIGDSILVKGKVDQYKGGTEFVPTDTLVGGNGSVQILKTGAKVPPPIEITLKDLNSEKYEGSLVKVKGLTKKASSPAWPLDGKYANIIVGTETDSTILFIDNDTDIDGTTEPVWPQDITGVISQYSSLAIPNNGYELLPRSTADFATVPADTTPVVTIKTAREDLDNNFIPDRKDQVLRINGVVISPDFTASAAGNNYYMTDGTAGILLYSTLKLTSGLNIGDSIAVKGKVNQYNGVTEFIPVDTVVGSKGSVVVLKSGAKVPAPIEITLKDLNSEKYEGCLVKVKGLKPTSTSVAWPTAVATKTTNMTVFAGNDTTTLFIDNDTDIDGTTEPVWPQDITGIATQYDKTAPFDGGYELEPRYMSDFTPSAPVVDDKITIAKARLLPANSKVTVAGTIISPNLSSSRCGYYISDTTAGIYIYGGTKTDYVIGDSVKVTGWLLPYNSLLEIADSSTSNLATVTKIVHGTAPKPIELTIAQFNSKGEEYESRLVKVKGLSKASFSAAWPATVASVNMSFMTPGSPDTLSVRINSYTEVPGKAEPLWPADITGILTQFSSTGVGGYQLVPRFMTDFDPITGVNENTNKIPEAYALDQNYPNPFNPSTKISFDLRVDASVTLKIYSIIGQEIATLVSNSQMSAGHQTLSFNASNLPSGIYIYRLEIKGVDGSNFNGIKKMMLLK